MRNSPVAVIIASILIIIMCIAVLIFYFGDTQESEPIQKPLIKEPASPPIEKVKKPEPEKRSPESQERDLSREILDGRIYVRHILVAYKGAREAGKNIKVEKEEAYNLALEIRDKCKENPESFTKLAKKYSDDRATGSQGGLIPPFDLREVDPSFRKAITELKQGEISKIVETPFGFHIIKREQTEEAVLQSILIPFKGALHTGDTVILSREDAYREALEIYKKIVTGEASFTDMARKYSRDPWAAHGGYMRGVVTKGKSIPHKEIENAAFSLKEGEVSQVFSSHLGFNVIKRHKIEDRQACNIVVYFGRTKRKNEARKIIEREYTAIKKKIKFKEVVKAY